MWAHLKLCKATKLYRVKFFYSCVSVFLQLPCFFVLEPIEILCFSLWRVAIGFDPPSPTSTPLSLVLAVAEKATLGVLGGLIVNAPRGVSPSIMTALRGFHYGRLVRLDAPACITSWGGHIAFVPLPPTTFAPR